LTFFDKRIDDSTVNKTAQVGACSVEQDGDILIVRWVDLPSLAELQQVYEVLEQLAIATGHHRVLFDLTRVDPRPQTAEVRRYATEWWTRHADRLVLASYGMGWTVRVLMELTLRAVSIFAKRTARASFWATEQEAREWLRAQP